MTAAAATDVDPVVEFRRHLPPQAHRSLTITSTVVALVHAATRNHGWTAAALATECSRDMPADLVNAGAPPDGQEDRPPLHPGAREHARAPEGRTAVRQSVPAARRDLVLVEAH
jgi:hypothetical protein